MEELIGKEVQIYPGDTYKKFGKILEITDAGILFLITRVDDGRNDGTGLGQYKAGKKRFISFSAKLSFQEI